MTVKITASQLREIVDYCAETGIFTSKISKKNLSLGKRMGSVCKQSGYVRIRINRRLYYAHRLAWLYVYGKYPDNHIDHKNHVRSANWIKNLRDVTSKENQKNQSKSRANTSGVPGVHKNKSTGRFLAFINKSGKKVWLGTFTELKDAARARRSAEVKEGYHVNHGK